MAHTPHRGVPPTNQPASRSGLWQLRLRPEGSRLRAVLHGFLLPLVVLQALLRDPADRRRYLRVTLVQAGLTLLVAVAVVPLYQSADRVTDQVEQEAELALQKTLGVVQQGFAAAREKPAAEDGEGVFLASLEQSAQDFRSELRALEPPPLPPLPAAPGVGAVPPSPPGAPPPVPDDAERLRARAEQRLAQRLERQQQDDARDVARRQRAALRRQRQTQAQQEARADAQQLAAELRTEALSTAAELREQTHALGQAAREAAAELREVARNNPQLAAELAVEQAALATELAEAQGQLQQAMAENQAQLSRQLQSLQRSTQGLATLSALRATETLQQRAGELESTGGLEAALGALETRLEALDEGEGLSPQARVEAAMQAAVEASFIAERAQRHLRQLREQPPPLGEAGSVDDAEALAEEARALARRARAEAKDQLSYVALNRRSGEAPPAPPEHLARALVTLSPGSQLLVYLAALYTALYVVQLLVISFSREYHDQLSRKAALATGIAPEDPELRPRVHLDWRWLRTRVARRWRALKLFALGLPVIYLLTWPLPGDWARTTLLTLWGVYWFTVFVAAKSARAWVDEGLAPDPWFLRLPVALAGRSRLLEARPFRFYGSLWRRHGLAVFAPAECVEQQPYAFAGLTVFRLLASLPLLKLFLRPLTPIAVAHLLEAHRERHPPRAAKVADVLVSQRVTPAEYASIH